jgi:hypothetical protein
MKKVALISVSLFSLAGLASAQAPTPPAKGAPAAPATKPAPPAAKPADKPATPADAKPMPPKPPEVPAELVQLTKDMGGTWKCAGQSMIGEQMMDTKATLTHRADPNLNKFYIQTSFLGTAAKMPAMKSTWYTTYDPTAKKLWRASMTARGGHTVAWGTIDGKKITWEGDATWASGATVKVRTVEEMVSAKEVKVTGEASKDGGKTWAKELDATCKK